jgi:hypothetical protein
VGAIADDRTTSGYSEPGENILLAGPSSGGWNGIYTTYATGAKIDCFGQMGGTSAGGAGHRGGSRRSCSRPCPRCPRASWSTCSCCRPSTGCATRRSTPRTTSAAASFWARAGPSSRGVVNAAGLAHSGLLGFGVPDAVRAIEMAQRTDLYWYHLPDQTSASRVFALGDGRVSAGSSQIYAEHVDGAADLRRVERAQLVVSLDAPSTLATLRIEVESPAGHGVARLAGDAARGHFDAVGAVVGEVLERAGRRHVEGALFEQRRDARHGALADADAARLRRRHNGAQRRAGVRPRVRARGRGDEHDRVGVIKFID